MLRVGRCAVDEALDFVELVHPDDAARVLAMAAGLTSETRRPARIPQRPAGKVQNLAGVIPRQRYLGGAHKVEAVALYPVHLLGVGA
ncbi:Uncharacterised protein [Mycobacterium tuberculosis]|uniref:Uncharacterized protein n=1 Tax=Mycobacterium tuberculosis TaxID=1773 RepID=A0A0U0R7Q6_MYCTX|nr:Uncharacterised protein [Mycobacterium tuberculosis]CKU96958.1 Uncharacterised protein [Mycobacterium tuberculosis]CNL53981.1 Uncharacterised protein [Mycobacterium tuberculosis]CNL84635.1 Uncharacterised protein [Mycobacterium tuberculosis]CNM53766.1 Uncharacterised protein [Mycobacterium tuberculosis]